MALCSYAVASESRESLFLHKNEKDELGFQALPCRKELSGDTLFPILWSISLRILCNNLHSNL